MKISRPEIIRQNGDVVFRVRVESLEKEEKVLWYAVDEAFGGFIRESCDAPLLALLIPAMARGEDIHVEGPVSERLCYNLSGPYQRLLRFVIPILRPVKIIPEQLMGQTQRASGVATGFSGGIDSYCVLADHHFAKAPVGNRVTHLLFNNVGAHGNGGEKLFRERFERVRPVAERMGLPFIQVNSNVDAFYRKIFSFEQTHTPRNASVPLLLQGGIGCFLYASANGFTDLSVCRSDTMARSDAISLPHLSTETIEMFSVGSQYTRAEKTMRVAEVAESHDTLNVCVDGDTGSNCSRCRKCMMTLLTLEIGGVLERYTSCFNLETYRRLRDRYITTVIWSRKPLLQEVVQFASERGYSFPFWPSLAGKLKRRMLFWKDAPRWE